MTDLKNQKRQFWVILTIIFLGYLGISIPYLLFPPLFLNVDYSFLPESWGNVSRSILLGVTLAAYPLGQFIGSPILGTLSDEYGRKHLLSISLVITAICNILTGVSIANELLSLLIISRFSAGLMEGNIAIARAMCADLKLLSKQRTFGRLNATASIAYLIGPFLGGLMGDKEVLEELTISTPFYLISILFFFLSILSSITLKKSTPVSAAKKKSFWQRINFVARMSALFSNKTVKHLLLTSTCFTLAVDIFYEFGPVYLTIKWDLTPSKLIFYNAILCLGLATGNGWLPLFMSSSTSKLIAVMSGIGGFALFLLSIVLSNSNLLMLAWFGLCGLSIGVATTLLTVKLSDSVSDTMQGEAMGTQLSLRVLGDGIICLFGGALLILSPKIILTLASMIALLAMAYYGKKRTSLTESIQ